MTENHQIVILGGGPAGSSCAIALARLGIDDILIVDSSKANSFKIGESIPPKSKMIFRKLGIWNAFKAEQHDPCYGSCSYWGDDKRGYNDFLLSPYGHGWHLDRSRFNQFLLEEARKLGVKTLQNTNYKESKLISNGHFQLSVIDSNNQSLGIDAQFVIDATGTRSIFAMQQGSKKEISEPLICLAARFNIPPSITSISKLTHIATAPYGWWYGASLPNNTFLVALFSDAETVKNLQLQKISNWQAHLNEMPFIEQLTQDLSLIKSSFKGFSAPSFCLDEIVGKNWMAIGDAASAYDPITSQGIMKSMSNAILAAQTLQQKITNPKNRLIDFHYIVKEQFQQYLNMRQQFYQSEMRWSDFSFWQKLQGKSEQVV